MGDHLGLLSWLEKWLVAPPTPNHGLSRASFWKKYPRTVEYGDSPDAQTWWAWLQKLNPEQLAYFLKWTSDISEESKDWNMDIDRDPKPDLKSKIDALSHAFPFPFAAEGLVPHPTQGGRFVLQDWNDLYLYRRRLPHAKFDVIRRHFAALVKMAEHAPE